MHRSSKVLFAFSLAILTMSLTGAATRPAFAGADKQQCTCNLKNPSSSGKVGSVTVNASACVRHHYGNWCDIYVAAMEHSRRRQQLYISMVSASSDIKKTSAQLDAVFMQMFDRYAASTARLDKEAAGRLDKDRGQLNRLIRQYTSLMARCIRFFADHKPTKFHEGAMSCSIGDISGWMSISFNLDGHTYSFLMAPS